MFPIISSVLAERPDFMPGHALIMRNGANVEHVVCEQLNTLTFIYLM